MKAILHRSTTVQRVVLAYSGGLDTSIIIPWLKEQYNDPEVIAVCVNLGQDEDWESMHKKAELSGASELHIIDAREEFAENFLMPLLRSSALYEDRYLLGTAIARPLQAKKQVELALKKQADAVAHGCTGKGNDQLRFELSYRALAPKLNIIAPWRIWDIHSRESAIDYAQRHNIPLGDISKKNIYSRDWNIWHKSHEGGDLEDLSNRPKNNLFQLTCDPKEAPDRETEVRIGFEQSRPVSINGKRLPALQLLEELNKLGAENAIGRVDLVETRIIGIKSRGVYETPAGTILHKAVSELDMITLDSDTREHKRQLANSYARLIYSGKWFSRTRECIDAFMAESAKRCSGEVSLVLYKGSMTVASRKSKYSLYSKELASFGEGSYDHRHADGFIKLYGLSTEVESLIKSTV